MFCGVTVDKNLTSTPNALIITYGDKSYISPIVS